MKIRKKISVLLIINMLVLSLSTAFFVCPVKADFVGNMQKAKQAHEALVDYISSGISIPNEQAQNAIKDLLAPLGFIVGYAVFSEAQFKDIFNSKNYGGIVIDNEDTPQEAIDKVSEALVENIIINDNSINYNSVSKQILNDYANQVKNTSPYYYAYSWDINQSVAVWGNGVVYNNIKRIIANNQNNYYCFVNWNTGNSNGGIVLVPIEEDTQFVQYIGAWDAPYIGLYSKTTWQTIDYSNIKRMTISMSNGYWEEEIVSGNTYVPNIRKVQYRFPTSAQGGFPGYGSTEVCPATSGRTNEYLVWNNLTEMKNNSLGNQPYYVNSNYQNIIGSNNDTTIDNSNSNNVSYGDVTNYINNYYGNNGEYPPQVIVNNYINGGGSGGGGNDNPDDPGGGGSGGGSGDGPSFDLGFLGTIGSLIGSLISGIGNLIVGILEGAVNAFNSIISAITNIISTVTQNVPEAMNTLMESVIGWLPDEWKAIISASILVSLLVGIIKLLRG